MSPYTVVPAFSTLMPDRKIERKKYERIYVRLEDIASAAVGALETEGDAGPYRSG